MPLYSPSREKQGRTAWTFIPVHLLLSDTSPSLSASVSPLLSTGYPGRSTPLTPDLPGCEIPKTQGRNSNSVCSASLNSPSSQRFSGRSSPAPGWCPSPHPPPRALHQHILPILLHWEQAPAQTKAEGCNSCVPSPTAGSKRTLLPLTVNSQILGAP